MVALLTAYAHVRLTLTYPGKGGTVTFFNQAFGPGILPGGMGSLLILSYVVLLAVYANAFSTYAVNFLPGPNQHFWRPVLTTAVIVMMAVVNFVGPGLVDRSEGTFNVGKLGLLLVFVLVGLSSSGLDLERLGPGNWVSVPDIVASGMLVFLSYEGFELVANASDRISNPQRTLPYAYYGSILTAIVFYMCIIVVTLGHFPLRRSRSPGTIPCPRRRRHSWVDQASCCSPRGLFWQRSLPSMPACLAPRSYPPSWRTRPRRPAGTVGRYGAAIRSDC